MHGERIDELPVILKVAKDLGIEIVLSKHLPSHGNMKRLSYGKLALGWIGFILCHSCHCKSHVSNWSLKVKIALEHILESPLTHYDFP